MVKVLEIKKVHDILIKSGLFVMHPEQSHIPNIESAPHHLCCIDNRIVLYLDHEKPEYYQDRGIKISILDWSYSARPKISFEKFLELTNDKVKEKLLFYITLFGYKNE